MYLKTTFASSVFFYYYYLAETVVGRIGLLQKSCMLINDYTHNSSNWFTDTWSQPHITCLCCHIVCHHQCLAFNQSALSKGNSYKGWSNCGTDSTFNHSERLILNVVDQTGYRAYCYHSLVDIIHLIPEKPIQPGTLGYFVQMCFWHYDEYLLIITWGYLFTPHSFTKAHTTSF